MLFRDPERITGPRKDARAPLLLPGFIRAPLAADLEVFLNQSFLRGVFWSRPGSFEKPLLSRTRTFSRPKEFFREERHQHRDVLLDASFLLPFSCSMLLHIGGSLWVRPCVAFTWLLLSEPRGSSGWRHATDDA